MQEAIEHFYLTQKTARYYQLGKLNDSTKKIWIVCHGYGQLSKYFIKKFEKIASDDTCIIAPEGLHRFYTEGHSGRVGASWMTKEDRINDIKDYILYLDSLLEFLTNKTHDAKIIILGFSQGVATACRWLQQGKVKPLAFVMWAGVFPSDTDFEVNPNKLKQTHLFLACGDTDRFIKKEDMQNELKKYELHNIAYKYFQFNGGHDIENKTLNKIAELIATI